MRVMTTRTTATTSESKLRSWRRSRGWTLAEVGGLTGLSESMISYLERGEKQLSPAAKVRVSRCLGARIQDLFDVEPAAEIQESLGA